MVMGLTEVTDTMTMAQHFLLSAKARTLSLANVLRLSDEEAYDRFKAIRFANNGGEAFCPKCGSTDTWALPKRKMWRCKNCPYQFSLTSGTIFASRKLSFRDILSAIAIFANGAKGHSALQLSRDLNVQYKTAFVMAHKLREAMGNEGKVRTLSGSVEVDDDRGSERAREWTFRKNSLRLCGKIPFHVGDTIDPAKLVSEVRNASTAY